MTGIEVAVAGVAGAILARRWVRHRRADGRTPLAGALEELGRR